MTDVQVPQGSTVCLARVDGALRVGNNATIRAEGGRVIVTGAAEFKGNSSVEGDLQCEELKVERSGRLRVSGDLEVSHGIDVSNAIEVQGTVKAESVDVGGHVKARSISCRKMRVGGTAEVLEALESDEVAVGGKLRARGPVKMKDLQVGGKSEIGGGAVTGTINVGGKFESVSALKFGDLRVYGVGTLAAGSEGRRAAVSGKLDAKGDLKCDDVQINGVASVSGDLKSASVDVNGKLDIRGSFEASQFLKVQGITSIDGAFYGGGLGVWGRFSAQKAVMTKDAEVYGEVRTAKGLKATSILVARGTRCTGPVVGGTVNIGGSGPGFSTHFWGQRLRLQLNTSQVEDVFGSNVTIGRDSRAKRVFGEVVEVGSGCDLEEVHYVRELKMAGHVTILHPPPQKVDKIDGPTV